MSFLPQFVERVGKALSRWPAVRKFRNITRSRSGFHLEALEARLLMSADFVPLEGVAAGAGIDGPQIHGPAAFEPDVESAEVSANPADLLTAMTPAAELLVSSASDRGNLGVSTSPGWEEMTAVQPASLPASAENGITPPNGQTLIEQLIETQ